MGRYAFGDAAGLPVGLLASLVVVLIPVYIGWCGWVMVNKHRAAVAGPESRADMPDAAARQG